MWYLLEDLLDQPLIMKVLLAWGWLAVWIMIFSTYSTSANFYADLTKAEPPPAAHSAPR